MIDSHKELDSFSALELLYAFSIGDSFAESFAASLSPALSEDSLSPIKLTPFHEMKYASRLGKSSTGEQSERNGTLFDTIVKQPDVNVYIATILT